MPIFINPLKLTPMKNLLLAGFIILLFGCKSPDLVMSPDLKQSAEAFDVKGKQGWQINQVISFGGFHSSKIKKGWVSHLNLEFCFGLRMQVKNSRSPNFHLKATRQKCLQ